MWLLPVEIPEEARAALPPGRYLLPWYYTADDVARFAGVARRLLSGIDHELRLPWDAVPVIAKGAPGSLDRTLLVVRIEDAALDAEAIEKGLSELRCRYTLVQVPAPRETGYAWQEQHLKPALVSLLREHVSDPEHPLASLNIGELPVLLAASLTPDALEMLDLLEAALTHRLRYARYGATESDWWRSLMLSAGRRLAGRLNRLRAEEAGCALEALLGADGGAGERFEAGAAALEKVGLGRVVAGSLSIGPLGRAIRERPVWGGLVEELEPGVWTPAARDQLASFSAGAAVEPELMRLSGTMMSSTAGSSVLLKAELPEVIETLTDEDLVDRIRSLTNALMPYSSTRSEPPPELRADMVSTLLELRRRERSAAPKAQKLFRLMRFNLVLLGALSDSDPEQVSGAITEVEDLFDMDPALLSTAPSFGAFYVLAADFIKDKAREQSDYRRAGELARKALALLEQPQARALAHLLLADLAKIQGDHAEAGVELERALEAGVEAGDQGLITMVETYRLQLALQDMDIERAAEILKENEHLATTPSFQTRLGILCMKQRSYEQAWQHFQNAESLSEERGNLSELADARLELGILALVMGKPKDAMDFISLALPAFKAQGHVASEATAHAFLGLVLTSMSAHDEAQAHLESALVLAERLGTRELLTIVYETLAHLAEQRGADEEAARWRERLRGLAPPAPPDSSDPLRGSSGSPSGRS